MTSLEFDGVSFFKLNFVAKFMVQNKESMERLILKNVNVESRGIDEMINVLRDSAHKIGLKVIHIENVNLSNKGLK